VFVGEKKKTRRTAQARTEKKREGGNGNINPRINKDIVGRSAGSKKTKNSGQARPTEHNCCTKQDGEKKRCLNEKKVILTQKKGGGEETAFGRQRFTPGILQRLGVFMERNPGPTEAASTRTGKKKPNKREYENK